MNKRIAIVGAGTAGLHLGLYLRSRGVDYYFANTRFIWPQWSSIVVCHSTSHCLSCAQLRVCALLCQAFDIPALD